MAVDPIGWDTPRGRGLSGAEYADPSAFDAAYPTAMLACGALLVLGGVVAWVTIPTASRGDQPRWLPGSRVGGSLSVNPRTGE